MLSNITQETFKQKLYTELLEHPTDVYTCWNHNIASRTEIGLKEWISLIYKCFKIIIIIAIRIRNFSIETYLHHMLRHVGTVYLI